jgi:transposase InsO family protein
VHRFIRAQRANHPVATLCRVLAVSRSGFYAAERRAPCRRARTDQRLTQRICVIHADSRGTYGAPRVQAMLAREGHRVGRKRVARLMQKEGVNGLIRRRKGKTTIRVPGIATAPDLVRREWNPTAPNRLWVADITLIRTWEGWLYLAAVLDCFSRRCVGWSIADHLRAELVLDAAQMAIAPSSRRALRRRARQRRRGCSSPASVSRSSCSSTPCARSPTPPRASTSGRCAQPLERDLVVRGNEAQ